LTFLGFLQPVSKYLEYWIGKTVSTPRVPAKNIQNNYQGKGTPVWQPVFYQQFICLDLSALLLARWMAVSSNRGANQLAALGRPASVWDWCWAGDGNCLVES
jgi:hypothetical protein